MKIILNPAELVTYNLAIEDELNPGKMIVELLVTFHTGDSFSETGVRWFKEELAKEIQNLTLQEQTPENILKVIRQLMTETPFSHSIKLINPVMVE